MSGDPFDQLSLFQNLSKGQVDLLRPLFRPVLELAGTVIFEQDDPAIFLYVVIEGEVHIRYKPEDGPAIIVSHVQPNGVVGWSTALGSPAYTSSAVCATDCQMLRVSGQDLRDLCEQYPETGTLLLERLATVIAERLRSTHSHVIALLEQGLHISESKPIAAGSLNN
jgi:CRP/FNR family cyclic AMP-dependent transcriptional regulator